MRRGLWLGVLTLAGCVTTRDAVGAGDSRLDESLKAEPEPARRKGVSCGVDGAGDLVILDGRTGGPLTCLDVTVTAEPASCPATGECPSTPVFRGQTNAQGRVLATPVVQARLVAVAEGFAPAVLANVTSRAGTLLELELMPAQGYWLKVLDAEGNYLPDVPLTFRQGEVVIAQLRSNVLANVLFTQRQPFSGQPVAVEADGFEPVTIADASELGDDGHTLVLRRR